MSVFWIKTLQLVLALSILIILHEGGHFFFARLFKIRVEKFYLFFDYKFHLFSTKDKWVEKVCPKLYNLETEYGIGWIPLGGYVAIAGMIDESLNLEQMKQPAQPWEFRVKPAWQRLLVMLGGVLVNFVLALVIYSAVLFTWGKDVLPMQGFTRGFWFNETARELGFKQGDLPYSVDGKPFEDYNVVELYTAMCEGGVVTVVRDGQHVDVPITTNNDLLVVLKHKPPFVAPLVPSVVDTVLAGTPAWAAGIRPGCMITAVDGKKISTWNEFDEIMGRRADVLAAGCSHEDSVRLRNIVVSYVAAGDGTSHTYRVQLSKNYTFGFVKCSVLDFCTTQHVEYTLAESIPAGISYGIETLAEYVRQLKYLFSAEGAQSVGSFGSIGNLFPPVWDWHIFWNMTAFLSIILFFMNLLPIPALDGGHALFCVAEMITGKQPSDKFLERAQYVGMGLLFMLMALAIFNDVRNFLF